MNVLYSGDANIADGVIISALSLSKFVKEPLHIYIMTAGFEHNGKVQEPLKADFADFLERTLKKYNERLEISLIDITEKFTNDPPSANMDTRFTPCCMLRLYADEILQLPDKILYLDNDVICRKDPLLFYHQQMGSYPIAGVLDYYGSHFFRQKFYKRDYLNSGVLLLNLREIRESGLFIDAREMCKTKEMFMPDQSALNKLCKKKIICDRRYNEQRKLKNDTVFQHFTTSFRLFPYFHSVNIKPWNIEGMHETLKIFEYDPLLEEYLKIKKQYTEENNNE